MATIAATALPILQQVGTEAGKLYSGLDEGKKTGLWATITGAGLAARSLVSIPLNLLLTMINVVILTIIFTWSLYRKYRAQINRGQETMTNPFGRAFGRGIALAMGAGLVLFIAGTLTGGLAAVAMLAVYPLAGIVTGVGSLIDIEAFHDFQAEGDLAGYTSGFTRWNIAFWPVFIIAMLASIVAYMGMNVAAASLAKRAADVVTGIL